MYDTLNPDQLKSVMRSWITGVAIVTGCYDGISHGMTASSFTSIALSPPTVLVGLQQNTRTHELVQQGGYFGVTILSTEQELLARRFAGQIIPDLPRFEGVETFTMVTGAPLIADGLAYLDCKVVDLIDVGKTTVFFGQVLAAQETNHDHQMPLLYFNREWRQLSQ